MEGMEIPIGGDLTGLQEAFAAVIAAIDRMGAQIAAALQGANNAAATTEKSMDRLKTSAVSNAQAWQRAETMFQRGYKVLSSVAKTGADVAVAVGGMTRAFQALNKASVALQNGATIATSINGWIKSAGGFVAAFKQIPAAMAAVASNPTFQKIVVGAAAAVAGVIAIRTAWRTAAAGASVLGSAAGAVFRGMIASARTAASTIASTFRGIASAPGKLLGGIPGLPIAGLVSAAGAVALLTSQVSKASDAAAVFEDMNVSVTHFMGSVSKANELMRDLADFGNRTPFETIDVQQTAEGLLGAGIRGDVAGITKDLAAVAKNGEQLKELGDALGKSFAKGKFQTEELNKFVERGINLIPALQAVVGKTGVEFQKAVEAGLGFETVTKAIRMMSSEGGQFFGLLEKRSRTFNGLTSTLASGWADIRRAFGQPLNDALKPILEARIASMGAMLEQAKKLGESVASAISIGFQAFKEGKVMDLMSAGINVAFEGGIDTLMRGLRGAVAFMATTLPPIFSALFATLSDPKFWSGLEHVFIGLGKTIAAEISAALPGADLDEIAKDRVAASDAMNTGKREIKRAGDGVNLGEVIADTLRSGAEAALKAAAGPQTAGLQTAMEKWLGIISDLKIGMLYDKKPAANKDGSAIAPKPMPSPMDALNKAIAPAVMSMARFGGGGGSVAIFGNLLSENRKQTNYQRQMVDLMKPGKPLVARFA